MKTWTRHRCQRNHKTTRTFLRCAIKRVAWIHGTGPFALIAWCRVPTVSLHQSPEQALQELERVNATGCGSFCSRRHEVIRLLVKEKVS